MDNCIFCRIARGEIPSTKVYEDEHVLAFLDLAPVNPGHTLVIPKNHAGTLLELETGEGEALIVAMRKIGKALMEGGAKGFNCLSNNFSAAGQEVMHLHWHVIPRYSANEFLHPWPGGKYENGDEMARMAARIKEFI